MSTGCGGRARWGGGACERVKGDFFASLHTGILIVSRLSGGDGSECSMWRNRGEFLVLWMKSRMFALGKQLKV